MTSTGPATPCATRQQQSSTRSSATVGAYGRGYWRGAPVGEDRRLAQDAADRPRVSWAIAVRKRTPDCRVLSRSTLRRNADEHGCYGLQGLHAAPVPVHSAHDRGDGG